MTYKEKPKYSGMSLRDAMVEYAMTNDGIFNLKLAHPLFGEADIIPGSIKDSNQKQRIRNQFKVFTNNEWEKVKGKDSTWKYLPYFEVAGPHEESKEEDPPVDVEDPPADNLEDPPANGSKITQSKYSGMRLEDAMVEFSMSNDGIFDVAIAQQLFDEAGIFPRSVDAVYIKKRIRNMIETIGEFTRMEKSSGRWKYLPYFALADLNLPDLNMDSTEEDPPVEVEDTPASSEDPPVEVEDTPASSEDPPVELENSHVETEEDIARTEYSGLRLDDALAKYAKLHGGELKIAEARDPLMTARVLSGMTKKMASNRMQYALSKSKLFVNTGGGVWRYILYTPPAGDSNDGQHQ